LTPYDLLAICKGIEKALGRQVREALGPARDRYRHSDDGRRRHGHAGADHPACTPDAQRRFVMDPLSEIAARWEFDGISVADLARHLRDDAGAQVCAPDAAATERVRGLLARD
jgi:2-amino-4-hydroxy-6-hydroxymethyldihydropteridine diphosphokinase